MQSEVNTVWLQLGPTNSAGPTFPQCFAGHPQKGLAKQWKEKGRKRQGLAPHFHQTWLPPTIFVNPALKCIL